MAHSTQNFELTATTVKKSQSDSIEEEKVMVNLKKSII